MMEDAKPAETAVVPENRSINVLLLLRKVDCNDGIAAYLDSIISSLSKQDIRFHIVSGPVSVNDSTEVRRNAIAAAASSWEIIKDLKQIPALRHLAHIRKIIREHNISIINVQGLGMLMWGKLLSGTTGRPAMATYHPSAPHQERDTAVANRDFSTVRKRYLDAFAPKALIVMSEESQAFLTRQSTRLGKRIIRVPGGIDDTHFRPPTPKEVEEARRRSGVTANDFVCVLVGRLSWNKGHEVLIAAIRRLVALHPEIQVRCLFVGTGEREQEIRDMAFVSEVDQSVFSFLGYVKDVREVLWACQVLVLPSRLEGFALVVPEAMATGVVPIRTPSGGATDQIKEGVTGFVIGFEDVNGLTKALEQVLDTKAREAMSAACISTAREKFSITSMAKRTKEIYLGLL